MRGTGKRTRYQKDDEESKNQKRRARTEKDQKDDDELIVYRILCPDRVIGSVIGKSGKVINSIRQETRAKVKVVDPFPGAKNRVITIYCYVKEKEELEVDDELNDKEPLCPAQDALLKVHLAIANALAPTEESNKRRKDKEKDECQLLVPSSQSANIIGKSGSTIKKLRSETRATIKVTPKDASDPTHSCAMEFDNFVLISGDLDAVKKAVFAISAIMYKFSPKEDVPLDTSVPEIPPSIIIPSDIPIFPGIYPSVDSIIPSKSIPSISSVFGSTHVPEFAAADSGNAWPLYTSSVPLVSSGAARKEELTVKVLCPSDKIGRVIGKGGSTIKSVRQASGARIEVNDAKADRDGCIIMVTSTESPEDIKSMAVEAVLLLQEKINDEDDDTVAISLLVPSKVIGCVIGKSGSIINEIRKRSRAEVHISKGKKPRCADAKDELVEVAGEVSYVRDALIQIILRLRDDVLTDREGGHNTATGAGHNAPSGADHLRSSGSTLSRPPALPNVPSGASLRYDPRSESENGFGMLSSGSRYSRGTLSMGDDDYGHGLLPSYSSNLYGGLPPPSTLEIVIPGHAVGKVMGKGGANLENIRKISGAAIEVSDSRSSRGDRVALISGTPEEKRSAENLIQAFILAT